jgi:hypothetical protein
MTRIFFVATLCFLLNAHTAHSESVTRPWHRQAVLSGTSPANSTGGPGITLETLTPGDSLRIKFVSAQCSNFPTANATPTAPTPLFLTGFFIGIRTEAVTPADEGTENKVNPLAVHTLPAQTIPAGTGQNIWIISQAVDFLVESTSTSDFAPFVSAGVVLNNLDNSSVKVTCRVSMSGILTTAR